MQKKRGRLRPFALPYLVEPGHPGCTRLDHKKRTGFPSEGLTTGKIQVSMTTTTTAKEPGPPPLSDRSPFRWLRWVPTVIVAVLALHFLYVIGRVAIVPILASFALAYSSSNSLSGRERWPDPSPSCNWRHPDRHTCSCCLSSFRYSRSLGAGHQGKSEDQQ